MAMCVQSIAPITLGKPARAANCAVMLACSTALYGNLISLAEMRIFPSHMAGMARLRVDWHSPNQLASVLRSNAGRSSAQCSRRIALKSGWWASCHHVPANPLYLWTHALFELHRLESLLIPLKHSLFLICIAPHAFISTRVIVDTWVC